MAAKVQRSNSHRLPHGMTDGNEQLQPTDPNHDTDLIDSIFGGIRLFGKEAGIVSLKDVWEAIPTMKNDLCLVGKILSRKRINVTGLQNALISSWKPRDGLKVSEIGDKLYLFQFQNKFNVVRTLVKAPWNFSNSLIILRRFDRTLSPKQYTFTSNSFWVHLHDLPLGLRNETVGLLLGSGLGWVLEVDDSFRKALRSKINLEIERPFRRCITAQNFETETHQIRIKYERLPEYCYVCGCIGHIEANCDLACQLKAKGEKIEYRFGAWLRAETEELWSPPTFAENEAEGLATPPTQPQKEQNPKDSMITLPEEPGVGQELGTKTRSGAHAGGRKPLTKDDGIAFSDDGYASDTNLVDIPLKSMLPKDISEQGMVQSIKPHKGKWQRFDKEIDHPFCQKKELMGKRKGGQSNGEHASKVLKDNSGTAIVPRDHGSPLRAN